MTLRRRRFIAALIMLAATTVLLLTNPEMWETQVNQPAPISESKTNNLNQGRTSPLAILDTLPVKGRAPKTGYSREQFGGDWAIKTGCNMRNIILHRDHESDVVDDECKVVSGTLNDPYTGKTIKFTRGPTTSDDVQIDHIVAVSNAWQTGAQQLSYSKRVALYNDPLNLLAVDGGANQQKGDGDAATWLPRNKSFRCQYVTRQVKVKQKYSLWVTSAEAQAIRRILDTC